MIIIAIYTFDTNSKEILKFNYKCETVNDTSLDLLIPLCRIEKCDIHLKENSHDNAIHIKENIDDNAIKAICSKEIINENKDILRFRDNKSYLIHESDIDNVTTQALFLIYRMDKLTNIDYLLYLAKSQF